jgi:hypothetical protein
MPELFLHFSIPFALAAPILGLKRAILVGFIAILPDIDALMHVYRSLNTLNTTPLDAIRSLYTYIVEGWKRLTYRDRMQSITST